MQNPFRPSNGLWSVETADDATPLSFLLPESETGHVDRTPKNFSAVVQSGGVSGKFKEPTPGKTAVDGISIEKVFFDYNETIQVDATKPRRFFMSAKTIPEIPAEGVQTLYDVFHRSCSRFSERPSIGQRPLVKIHIEEKEVVKVIGDEHITQLKKWTYPELGPYKVWTFAQVREEVGIVGSGLRHLGLEPKGKLSIFAPTSAYWFFVAYGAFNHSVAITTAYETLGFEGLAYSVNQNDATFLFTHTSLLPIVEKAIATAPCLKTVIYYGDEPDAAIKDNLSARVQFVSYDKVRLLGQEKPVDHTPPSRNDVACIMYTSGSTGMPKGVVMNHSTIVGALAGVVPFLEQYVAPEDVYIAYLPLAHILEFTVEACLFSMGMLLGYGSPRSLTDSSVRGCKGDLRELRPTIMCGVPQVWETIRKGILAKLDEGPKFAASVFWAAFSAKQYCTLHGIPGIPSLIDNVIFKKVKEATGGRLRYALSGGAALHSETHKFLNTLLCPIFQGYGMTETCGTISMQNPDICHILNSVGHPFLCTEFCLVSVPDTDYCVTNKPRPQGELWVRGANVMHSYYKQDDLNKEVRSKHGSWLKTGDIVELCENGTISVIDRRKNLFKLANGEYIAIEKLESIYKSSTIVQNLCVTASSSCTQPIVVVVPVHRELEKVITRLNLDEKFKDPMHLSAACANKHVANAVLKALVEVGRKNKFSTSELVGGIVLVDDEWTSDNGMLTPAQKLRRTHIEAHYKTRIEQVYSDMRC